MVVALEPWSPQNAGIGKNKNSSVKVYSNGPRKRLSKQSPF